MNPKYDPYGQIGRGCSYGTTIGYEMCLICGFDFYAMPKAVPELSVPE